MLFAIDKLHVKQDEIKRAGSCVCSYYHRVALENAVEHPKHCAGCKKTHQVVRNVVHALSSVSLDNLGQKARSSKHSCRCAYRRYHYFWDADLLLQRQQKKHLIWISQEYIKTLYPASDYIVMPA